jgi:hypothetical protein
MDDWRCLVPFAIAFVFGLVGILGGLFPCIRSSQISERRRRQGLEDE